DQLDYTPALHVFGQVNDLLDPTNAAGTTDVGGYSQSPIPTTLSASYLASTGAPSQNPASAPLSAEDDLAGGGFGGGGGGSGGSTGGGNTETPATPSNPAADSTGDGGSGDEATLEIDIFQVTQDPNKQPPAANDRTIAESNTNTGQNQKQLLNADKMAQNAPLKLKFPGGQAPANASAPSDANTEGGLGISITVIDPQWLGVPPERLTLSLVRKVTPINVINSTAGLRGAQALEAQRDLVYLNEIRANPSVFGMQPRGNLVIQVTPQMIAEHALGKNLETPLLSASELSFGAKTINGTGYQISLKVLAEQGINIIKNEEVIAAVKQYAVDNPEAAFRVNAWLNAQSVELETMIVGQVPAEAVSSMAVNGRTYLIVSKGARVVGYIGIGVTVLDLSVAGYQAYESGNPRVFTDKALKTAGGLAGAIGGAKIGAAAGTVLGIETGPGAIVFGLIGMVGGAILGEEAMSRAIEHIENFEPPNDPKAFKRRMQATLLQLPVSGD
ncbi:MAG: hypothetical protein ACRD4O_06145, partial [Bryobacteraceae bacterium]